MKDEYATLKGLNINALKVQTFQGCNFYFIFSTGFTGGYSNFILSGYFIDFSETDKPETLNFEL